MSIIVSKFGGSSLADANMFRRVKNILSDSVCSRYIVLSAPGKRFRGDEKITDLLCRCHQIYASGGDGSALLGQIKQRFREIIETLEIPICAETLLASLEDDVKHSLDRAASRGEYLCARIFAAYIDLPFVDASTLIFFDETGRIDYPAIHKAVRQMVDRLPHAIIPGFYGVMPDGEIKTFSRGGSDITGAIVAAACNAKVYENWTDVDGLMSIDPAYCNDAICHPSVSYRQMRMLSRAGANVLHPYCLEPVCEAGVPTQLRNTFAPEKPGTYISESVRHFVPCICAKSGFRMIDIDNVSEETRNILDGLALERFLSSDGHTIVPVRGDKIPKEERSAVISIFGLQPERRAQAQRCTEAEASLSLESCIRVLVYESRLESAMKCLHALLID